MKNVTIVQRVLPHYRVELFRQLRESLLDSGINITLMYGQHLPETVPETVNVDYDWAVFIPNHYFKVQNTELVYQKLPVSINKSDLIIIEQANRLLSNYILHAQRYITGLKIAYWGHGMNFQSKGANWLKVKLKTIMLTKVDWWFAYTQLSADIVVSAGFSENKITILNNTIDNHLFKRALNNVSEQEVSDLLKTLDIRGDDICLYCGGLYADKQIDFLIKSCTRVRQDNPNFELVIVGSGPDRKKVESAAGNYEWLHYVGPQYGENRAKYFCAAKLLLMPGPVGLVVLDSFIAKKPLVTTDISGHGPEIDYLDNGKNGVMCRFDYVEYANTVNNYLIDSELYNNLVIGCEASASEYTMANMVQSFKNGILNCLNMSHD